MDTYAADDYVSIAARLREIEKRHDSSAASWSPSKWGIWIKAPHATWTRVRGSTDWIYAASDAPNPEHRPSLYATRVEAQTVIDAQEESIRTVAEAREYPE